MATSVIETLPDEIVTQILECCNNSELVKLSNVCQRWRRLICDYLTRTRIPTHLDFNDSAQTLMMDNESLFAHVTDIDIVIYCPHNITNLITLLLRLKKVETLHVVWEIEFEEGWPEHVRLHVTSLSDLESFTFEVKKSSTFVLNEQYCNAHKPLLAAFLTLFINTRLHTLTSLRFINVPFEDVRTERNLRQLIRDCRNLTHLTLKNCLFEDEDEDAFLDPDLIPSLSCLEYLDLTEFPCSIDLSFIELVHTDGELIYPFCDIICDCLEVHSGCDVTFVELAPRVKRLELRYLDTDQLSELVSHLNDCSQLQAGVEELVVACTRTITDDILLSIVLALPRVETVRADWQRELTNEGVVKVVTSSPALKYISVAFVSNISDELLDLLADVPISRRVHIFALGTTLSDHRAGRYVYTGRNMNICVTYKIPD